MSKSKLQDLLAQRAELEKRIALTQRTERADAIGQVRTLMLQYGLTLVDLGSKAVAGPKTRKTAMTKTAAFSGGTARATPTAAPAGRAKARRPARWRRNTAMRPRARPGRAAACSLIGSRRLWPPAAALRNTSSKPFFSAEAVPAKRRAHLSTRVPR